MANELTPAIANGDANIYNGAVFGCENCVEPVDAWEWSESD